MKISKLTLIIVLLATTYGVGCKGKNKNSKTDGYSKNNTETCDCNPAWFPHTTTPAPMEGAGSPFDTSSTTNCIFHQWSWQKFLWLTRPLPNGHVFFQDSLQQVDAQMTPITPQNNIALVLEDTSQAGSSGQLYTNPAYSVDSQKHLVYYSIFVNSTLMDAAVTFKTAIGADTNNLSNMEVFPISALELKVSWVDINSIPVSQQASYYKTQAMVKQGNNYQLTTVALLGMHVVGRVINHPEFIWATFEHQEMASYYDWANTTTTQDAPIASANQMLLFAQGSTTTLGGITWDNTTHTNVIPFKQYSLYKYGVPRTASNNFLTGTSQSEPLNYNNIDGLNNCVVANLSNEDVWRNYFYNGSIWVNTDGLNPTQQASLIVSQGGSIGAADSNAVARGSLNVFNLTMETYVQTLAPNGVNTIHSIGVSQLFNCFTCHTASPFSISYNGVAYKGKTSPLYLSHIYRNYVSRDNNTTVKDAKHQGVIDTGGKPETFAEKIGELLL